MVWGAVLRMRTSRLSAVAADATGPTVSAFHLAGSLLLSTNSATAFSPGEAEPSNGMAEYVSRPCCPWTSSFSTRRHTCRLLLVSKSLAIC